MFSTQQQIRFAEAAYASLLDRTLFDMCDFEEVTPEKEYHLYESYIERDNIEVFTFPFNTADTTYYITGLSSSIFAMEEELVALFTGYDNVSKAYVTDDAKTGEAMFFVVFKKPTLKEEANIFILDCYGYVAHCLDEGIEVETDLPF